MSKVVVVGGGASGMMAALASSKKLNKVILLEKNEKLGKKIYITGKGRCNLTNACSINDFFSNVITNSKFLYSSIYSLSPDKTMELFNDLGLKLTIERGNRVFPLSNKASDVTKTLEKALIQNDVDIRLNQAVLDIIVENDKVVGVLTENGKIECDKVVIATGGLSYSSTGSTGDGYRFSKKYGHKIVIPKPSLVGVELVDPDFIKMQGLSLKNVSVKVLVDNKAVYNDFGEMLFTHFGVSGPIILSSSCYLTHYNLKNAKLIIDLKPALDEETLDDRLIREFTLNKNKSLGNAIRSLVPSSMVEVIISRATLNKNKNCSEITKNERKNIIQVLKNFEFNIKKLRPIEEAIITSGGVAVSEINPKTMESKLTKGLYFCGEVIDVDAFTGGFNMQIAFSTGYLAGNNT